MKSWKKYAGFYVFVCAAAICGALLLSRAGTAAGTVAAARELPPVVVIDAGHGGEDGGARSCTGVQESGINLEIALRVNDLMHFLGMQTRMIRTTDCAVYTEGARTIAEKKVSDIHNRVRMVEETPGALLVSIHQNNFPEGKYRGAQVFYAKTDGSRELAEQTQRYLAAQVDPNNRRECKAAQDIYLLKHASCTAILVECGFLSNPGEEALLREAGYQKKLAAAICCSVIDYLEAQNEV